jgi:hypothetical protein
MIDINLAIAKTIKNLEQIAQEENSVISPLAAYREASEVISQAFDFDIASFGVYLKQYPDLATDRAIEGEEITVAIERNLRSRILTDTVKGVEAHIAARGDVRGLPLDRLLSDIVELMTEWERIQSFKTSYADRAIVWAERCRHDLNSNTLRLLTASLNNFLRQSTTSVHLELQLVRGKLHDILQALKTETVVQAAAA